jgi:hypothetical protein
LLHFHQKRSKELEEGRGRKGKKTLPLSVVNHTYNPSIQKAKAGRQVQHQPGLQSETQPPKKLKKKKTL